MPAKDLGTKHVCVSCGTKFYDLKKPDALCPKCGADQRVAPAPKQAEGRRSRLSAVPKIVEPIEPVEVSDDDEAESLDDEAEADADE